MPCPPDRAARRGRLAVSAASCRRGRRLDRRVAVRSRWKSPGRSPGNARRRHPGRLPIRLRQRGGPAPQGRMKKRIHQHRQDKGEGKTIEDGREELLLGVPVWLFFFFFSPTAVLAMIGSGGTFGCGGSGRWQDGRACGTCMGGRTNWAGGRVASDRVSSAELFAVLVRRSYIRGLLGDAERKNGSHMAEQLGEATPDGIQHLLALSGRLGRRRRPRQPDRPTSPSTIGSRRRSPWWSIETGFVKKGMKSVGVGPAVLGGRRGGSRIARSASSSATRPGTAGPCSTGSCTCPRLWAADERAAGRPRARCASRFATKIALARSMIGRALDAAWGRRG